MHIQLSIRVVNYLRNFGSDTRGTLVEVYPSIRLSDLKSVPTVSFAQYVRSYSS